MNGPTPSAHRIPIRLRFRGQKIADVRHCLGVKLEMTSEYLVLIGTLGGSAIGAISSVIAIWVTKAYEEKTLRRQLLINAGIEQWKKAFDLANQTGGAVPPIEDYIIHLLALSELMAARMTPARATGQCNT